MRDSRKYADLTADDLCDHEGGRTITTQGTFAWNPEHAPGTALLLCDDCGWTLGYAPSQVALLERQAAADALANCTGSVQVTDTVEVRDATTGQLVILSSVPSRPLAQRQADLAAQREAAAEAEAAALRADATTGMEYRTWSASCDLRHAATLARQAGLEDQADALDALAAQVEAQLPKAGA